jgi:hypothetical protein
MLPAKISALIGDSIDVYLKAQGYRPPRFGQRLLAQSFAGEVIQPAKVAAVSAKEIETVSNGIVEAIRKVIDKVEVTSYETFQSDLLQVFDSEFDKCAEAIRKFGCDTFSRLRANASPADWFNERFENARQARHLELKLLAAQVVNSDGKKTRGILYNSDNEPVAIIEPEN